MRNILIIASVALNIFLVGLIAGGHLFGDEVNQPPQQRPPQQVNMPPSGELLPLRSLASLPPEYRRKSRQLIRENMQGARESQRAIHDKRREITQLLMAEQLDQQAIASELDALFKAQATQQKLMADTILKVLEELPDEERIALLKRIEERRARQREMSREKMEIRKDEMRNKARERMRDKGEGEE